ncbi:MAG: hypothetical protein SFY32_05880 [Bacteroidota bacterium]|nr:hypothetical protein [Bacteroidota bacterium]
MKKIATLISIAALVLVSFTQCVKNDPAVSDDVKVIKEDMAKLKEELAKLRDDHEKLAKDAIKAEVKAEDKMEGSKMD